MGALPPTSFGGLLKQYRLARHLTQEALADRAGLSLNAINSLERGVRQRPYPDTLARLAEALSLSPEERSRFEAAAREQPLTPARVLASPADQAPSPHIGRTEYKTPESVTPSVQKPTSRRVRRLVVLTGIVALSLIALLLMTLWHPFSCRATHCGAQAQAPVLPGIYDANVELYLAAIQSTYFAIPGDPAHYALNHLPTTIPVQPLDTAVRVPYRVIVGIHSVQQGRFGLIIHEVALKVVQVASVPTPLNVWAQPTREYSSNLYQIPYTAESAGAVVQSPPESLPDVQLVPGEADDLDIEVTANTALDLRFQIQVNYRVTNESAFHTLTLPDVFEVVFATAAIWHLYQLQEGHLVPSS